MVTSGLSVASVTPRASSTPFTAPRSRCCTSSERWRIPARCVARVVDYIEGSIDEDLRLCQLANVAAMSVYHFARRFRETVGVSPHAYVLSRRLDRARGMLRHREITLAQVAAACGFSSQAQLTTTFLNAFGVTPGKYRRAL